MSPSLTHPRHALPISEGPVNALKINKEEFSVVSLDREVLARNRLARELTVARPMPAEDRIGLVEQDYLAYALCEKFQRSHRENNMAWFWVLAEERIENGAGTLPSVQVKGMSRLSTEW